MNTKDLIVFSMLPGIGNSIIKDIVLKNEFTDLIELKENFLANKYKIPKLRNIDQFKNALINIKKYEDKCEEIYEQCHENKISIISLIDKNYPNKFKTIKDMPSILYVKTKQKSNLDWPENENIGIVGSRDANKEVLDWTFQIAKELCNNCFNVISGLAKGVDTSAHMGSLEISGKGITTAVIPNTIEISPVSNRDLADQIIHNNGLIISENAPNVPFNSKQFIQRNRIISALTCDYLIVPHCKINSGTLSTIKYAIKLNKKILIPKGHTSTEITYNAIIQLTKNFQLVTLDEIIEIIKKQSFHNADQKQKDLFK